MADAKRILGWLQETGVTEQLSVHCETVPAVPGLPSTAALEGQEPFLLALVLAPYIR
jgi:hypothetical protein